MTSFFPPIPLTTPTPPQGEAWTHPGLWTSWGKPDVAIGECLTLKRKRAAAIDLLPKCSGPRKGIEGEIAEGLPAIKHRGALHKAASVSPNRFRGSGGVKAPARYRRLDGGPVAQERG